MTWQRVASRDPYLAGSLASDEQWEYAEQGVTPEALASGVGLTGDRLADFLRGWNDAILEQQAERKGQMFREYEEMSAGYEKGDPAAR